MRYGTFHVCFTQGRYNVLALYPIRKLSGRQTQWQLWRWPGPTGRLHLRPRPRYNVICSSVMYCPKWSVINWLDRNWSFSSDAVGPSRRIIVSARQWLHETVLSVAVVIFRHKLIAGLRNVQCLSNASLFVIDDNYTCRSRMTTLSGVRPYLSGRARLDDGRVYSSLRFTAPATCVLVTALSHRPPLPAA